MTPRRPVFIFDFGNVLAFFDYAVACETYGRRVGSSGAEFLRTLRARGLTGLVETFERGEISSEEFTRAVSAIAGLEVSHEEFAAAWADIFRLNEPVARVVRELRDRGHTLILGSNTNAIHAAHFRRQFRGVLAHFDRLVLSFEVGQLKPSAGFYRACVEAAGAAAADCVFIDDLVENVRGARSAGLQAIHYGDPEGLRKDLRAYGVDLDTLP
jgi:putative hydrolase of the HAD superfamily